MEDRMNAAGIMTFGAATIEPGATVMEAAQLMLTYRLSGVPVVESDGRLVGIVTEGDLLSAAAQRNPGRPDASDKQTSPGSLRVRDVMSSDVVTVGESTPIADIAALMRKHHIKRVPVTDGGKVIGIVSRADLLRRLAREAELMPGATDEDHALRDRVLEVLSKQETAGWTSINVIAAGGLVEIRGAMTDPTLPGRLLEAARAVPGVRDVTDHMVVVGPASGRI
jgi:CBS domain-containing protein